MSNLPVRESRKKKSHFELVPPEIVSLGSKIVQTGRY